MPGAPSPVAHATCTHASHVAARQTPSTNMRSAWLPRVPRAHVTRCLPPGSATTRGGAAARVATWRGARARAVHGCSEALAPMHGLPNRSLSSTVSCSEVPIGTAAGTGASRSHRFGSTAPCRTRKQKGEPPACEPASRTDSRYTPAVVGLKHAMSLP
eukprot:scaffold1487_cov116-Isochrysis_galbana.AAC.17